MARGVFVTFEGQEGCGKTTQVSALSQYYERAGYRVLVTREPGGTKLGNELRALLLEERSEKVDPMAELLLMEAARAQHVNLVLKNALHEYDLVICDRFTDATLVYQGYGRGLPLDLIRALNSAAAPGLVPDLTILLDLPVDQSLKRAFQRIAKRKGGAEDRFEREAHSFHEKIREGYLALAKGEPGRFLLLDGTLPIDEITRAALPKVDSLLSKLR